MPDIVQVTVKTKTMDLFRFMIFHAYTSLSGSITFIFGVCSLLFLPFSYFVWEDKFVSLILFIVVLMYLVITPLNMLSQSKRQVISNPVFKNPITYHISEEILEVQQYTGTVRLYWNQLVDIKVTPFDFLFYVNDQQAFVVPKKEIDLEEIGILVGIIDKVKSELPPKKTLKEKMSAYNKPKVQEESVLEKHLRKVAEADLIKEEEGKKQKEEDIKDKESNVEVIEESEGETETLEEVEETLVTNTEEVNELKDVSLSETAANDKDEVTEESEKVESNTKAKDEKVFSKKKKRGNKNRR